MWKSTGYREQSVMADFRRAAGRAVWLQAQKKLKENLGKGRKENKQ